MLKSNFEFYVFWIERCFFGFGLSYVAGKGFFDISNAGGNVIGGALGQHFYSTVVTVTHKTGQPMAVGYVKSGIAEAYALDSADENYILGGLNHLYTRISLLDLGIECFYINL